MKRALLILTAILLAFSLCACNGVSGESGVEGESGEAKAVTLDIETEAGSIIEKYSLSGGKRYSSKSTVAGEYLDEDLIRSYYGDAAEMPDFSQVAAYAVYIDESKPINPCEFGIFEMKDGADAETFKKFLEARINAKIENAKSYPSVDTEPLKTAKFTIMGKYVWYCAVKGGNAEINSTLEGKLK